VADDHLRTLERRFRETGAVEDEAAWLRERVRAGVLPEARARLAAELGYPAARRHWPADDSPTLLGWRLRIARRCAAVTPPAGGARFSLAVVEAALLALPPSAPVYPLVSGMLEAVEDWVVSAGEAQLPAELERLALRHRGYATQLVLWLSRSIGGGDVPCQRALRAALLLLEESAERPDPRAWVEAALHSRLCPWLLGCGDPVRTRVAMRGETDARSEGLGSQGGAGPAIAP